ncbi:MAG: PIN domain-containing protein [Candidatus Marinimicrobia bacterium]|nr:PIN domain-containing protein [Candidatus Neomarinimicrobiota bacterium]
MKDKYFIDTNILVYANDRTEKGKYERAKQILFNGIANEDIAISTQVLSEFYVTVTKKIKVKLPANTAKKEILLLKAIEIVEIDFNLIIQAINISDKNKLTYWDSLIIAAAQEARCNIVYSEDFNPDQTIGSVTIKNPF